MRAVCDVCAAHGDKAAVGVDVNTQCSSLREGKTHFHLNAGVECRASVSERILVSLSLKEKKRRLCLFIFETKNPFILHQSQSLHLILFPNRVSQPHALLALGGSFDGVSENIRTSTTYSAT